MVIYSPMDNTLVDQNSSMPCNLSKALIGHGPVIHVSLSANVGQQRPLAGNEADTLKQPRPDRGWTKT